MTIIIVTVKVLWQKKFFLNKFYIVTKLWPFVICHCEIGNHFFLLFLNADRNTFQKICIYCIGLNKKLPLEMILDLGKCPNQKMPESKSAVFSPMSEIIFKTSFLIRSYIITVLIFWWSVLVRLIRIKKWNFYFNFQNGFGQCRGLFSHLYIKLDGIGPVDKRPSTDKLHHFVQKNN